MGMLQEMIKGYFARQDWQIQQHETEPYFCFEYGNEAGSWVCLIWYIEELSQLLIYSIHPEQIPASRRMEVAEFLMRANYGQVLGCFEMNFDDGETRYRTGVDFGGEPANSWLFALALNTNLRAYGDALEALESVVAGNAGPKEAAEALFQDTPDLDFRQPDV